jgi:hypothetical protein
VAIVGTVKFVAAEPRVAYVPETTSACDETPLVVMAIPVKAIVLDPDASAAPAVSVSVLQPLLDPGAPADQFAVPVVVTVGAAVKAAVPVVGQAIVNVIWSLAAITPLTVSVKFAAAWVAPDPDMVVADEPVVIAAETVGVAADATPAPTIERPPNRVTPVRAATPHRRIDGKLFIGPPWAFCPEENQGFHYGHHTTGDQLLYCSQGNTANSNSLSWSLQLLGRHNP